MAITDLSVPGTLPAAIGVRGARHNNLRDVDLDVPLWRTVAVVGVSGSGKTSLAIGTLYAEGMQRYLSGLSTYSRRRLTQAQRPDVDRIDHLPPALALRQRPPTPGPRSTVGTMSEVLNVLRLMMSRLGSHLCPNGHRVDPSIAAFAEEIVCPVCGARFEHPSAESFAFNSYGACPACQGLGVRSEVDEAALVPDTGKTIEQGAVLPWNSGGRRLSIYAAGELGVRLDVPYKSLTQRERNIVLRGAPVQRQVTLHSGRNERTVRLSVNYDNAVAAVERSLRSDNERTRRLAQRQRGRQVVDPVHVRPLGLGQPPTAVGAQALQEPVHTLGVQRADGQRRLARSRHADHRDRPPQRHVDVDIPQVVVPGPAHADDRGQGSRHGNITSRHMRQRTAVHRRMHLPDRAGAGVGRPRRVAVRGGPDRAGPCRGAATA